MKSVAHLCPAVVWLQGSWSERQCSAELCFHCRQPCWWQILVAGEKWRQRCPCRLWLLQCQQPYDRTLWATPAAPWCTLFSGKTRGDRNRLWLQCITINASCSFTSRSSILPKSCFKGIWSKLFSGFALYKIWVVLVHAQLATTVLELELCVSNLRSSQVYTVNMDKIYGKVLDGKGSNNSDANFSILIFKMRQWNNKNGNQRYCKY